MRKTYYPLEWFFFSIEYWSSSRQHDSSKYLLRKRYVDWRQHQSQPCFLFEQSSIWKSQVSADGTIITLQTHHEFILAITGTHTTRTRIWFNLNLSQRMANQWGLSTGTPFIAPVWTTLTHTFRQTTKAMLDYYSREPSTDLKLCQEKFVYSPLST